MSSKFNALSFFGRWLFALALVFGTYNPTRYSFAGWITSDGAAFGPPMALVGIALLIGWIIFLRATFMSMGWLGIVLGAALFGALTWVILLVLSLILATGMSWSHIRRRLTGQFDVDDVED